jgi:hypothetical protein
VHSAAPSRHDVAEHVLARCGGARKRRSMSSQIGTAWPVVAQRFEKKERPRQIPDWKSVPWARIVVDAFLLGAMVLISLHFFGPK